MKFVIGWVLSTLILLSVFSVLSAYKYVDKLDLTKYDGLWYEIYQDQFDNIFQKGASCVNAKYTLYENNTVGVLNSEIKNGEVSSISGYAYYSDNNSGGQLTVNLNGRDAAYWVVALGPIVNDKYEYSIVSDDKQLSLFVLARDVDTFMKKYDNEVLEIMKSLGFTKNINQPILVDQSSCNIDNSVEDVQGSAACNTANYLRKAGFPESTIGTMTCISQYESSFNCKATNKNNDGSTDYGLMQINSYYWCSGDPTSKYNECGTSCDSLFDCQKNANCAYKVYKEQGYNAWYGYKNHKQECDNAQAPC
jgi:lysozyme C